MRERDYSIDIIKFLAVFLIINSHSDIAYPKYDILATGGAIGDALFLFCSGYTLFLGQMRDFGNYYKRRICRIYPSCFACMALMMLLPWVGHDWSQNFRASFFKDFINAIMIYYVLLWLIRKYLIKHLPWVFVFVGMVVIVAYIFFFPYKHETGSKGLYGITSIFRWLPYFGINLMGAYLGIHRKELKYSLKWDTCKFFVCLFLFYSIQFAAKKMPSIAPAQIVTVFFLAGVVFYLYKIFNAHVFKRIYDSKWGNSIIMIAGGLCLESYLVQYCVITDKMNNIFPLNLIVIILGVLTLAYICRCLARLFSQTFRTEDYEWKIILSLR